jgi:ribonuclease MRP protein subunit RMP1
MPPKTSTHLRVQTPTPPRLNAEARDVDPTQISVRRTELLQIFNILTLAYHRNKNQHRRSRWWKELSLLRRNLRRLLDTGAGEGEGKGAVHRHAGGLRVGTAGKNEGGTEERVRFLRERLIPRCWVAFSGVVGDNQYAALGLMLLGTLGRLGRVVGWEGDEQGMVEVVDVRVDVGQAREMGRREDEDVHAEDLGVPLLREEVMQTEEAQTKENEKKHVRSESEAVSVETDKLAAKKKPGKKHRDAIDELFSSLI